MYGHEIIYVGFLVRFCDCEYDLTQKKSLCVAACYITVSISIQMYHLLSLFTILAAQKEIGASKEEL
jgi:hypothetical protein